MTKVEFDEFANSYTDVTSRNTRFFEAEYDYFARYRAKIIKEIAPSKTTSILDFGCGVGLSIRSLREELPNTSIVGCDPSQESLALAREREPNHQFMTAEEIPAAAQFDVISAVSVFHHIPPADRDRMLLYCRERLKPAGLMFIFEHNPYNPVTRHLVASCPVDQNAILLARRETIARFRRTGFAVVASGYFLFFPNFISMLRPLETLLRWLPFGGQYFAVGARLNDLH